MNRKLSCYSCIRLIFSIVDGTVAVPLPGRWDSIQSYLLMVDGTVALDGLGIEALVGYEEVLTHVQNLQRGVLVTVAEREARCVTAGVRLEDRLDVRTAAPASTLSV